MNFRLGMFCSVCFFFGSIILFFFASQKSLALFYNFHPSFLHSSLFDIFWNLIDHVLRFKTSFPRLIHLFIQCWLMPTHYINCWDSKTRFRYQIAVHPSRVTIHVSLDYATSRRCFCPCSFENAEQKQLQKEKERVERKRKAAQQKSLEQQALSEQQAHEQGCNPFFVFEGIPVGSILIKPSCV